MANATTVGSFSTGDFGEIVFPDATVLFVTNAVFISDFGVGRVISTIFFFGIGGMTGSRLSAFGPADADFITSVGSSASMDFAVFRFSEGMEIAGLPESSFRASFMASADFTMGSSGAGASFSFMGGLVSGVIRSKTHLS